MWREVVTAQFQVLFPHFLGGWGNNNSQDTKCPGRDYNYEPPEYKLKNEAWFHISEQMNILNNCSADNPILIHKVITCWLMLVCGML